MEHRLLVDDAELHILQAAVRAYVKDFGHEESDVLRPAKALLVKLEGAEAEAHAPPARFVGAPM